MRRYTVLWITLSLIAVRMAPAVAEYPERAIELIIPFVAGGEADIEGRLLAKGMSQVLGVPVVAVNKPGAGGAVTYAYVQNARPDGYTVAWISTSILITTTVGHVPFRHDALDHVGRVEFQPVVFAVKADAPWPSFQAFVAACKEQPGTLKVGNSGTGSATHLAAIAMMNTAGCQVIHVPLGIQRRNAELLSGETDAMAAPLTGVLELFKAEKIRLLSHLSGDRNAVIPDIPPMKELGYDIELDLFRGLSVPKGTPAAIRDKLAEAMMQAANSQAFMDLAEKSGFTVAPMDAARFDRYLEQTGKMIQAMMQEAGLDPSPQTP